MADDKGWVNLFLADQLLALLPCVKDSPAMDSGEGDRLEYHILQWILNVDR